MALNRSPVSHCFRFRMVVFIQFRQVVCKIIKIFYTDHIVVQIYRESKCCPQWRWWVDGGGGGGSMLCN